jgi:SsrA-binding protein
MMMRSGIIVQRPGQWKTMTAKSAKKKSSAANASERVISENRKARHNYTVLDTLECGLVLVGSEVKSLREGKISLEEAYGRVKDDEVWLVGCDIPEYIDANRFNHRPKRPRKLLLHRREVKRFAHRAYEKGLTLVPLKMYFSRGIAKVLMGVCRGKQQHDKRQAMKKAEAQRNIQRQMFRQR